MARKGLLFAAWAMAASASAVTVDVPKENRSRGEMPGMAAAGAMAELLVKAIDADDVKMAQGAFFPPEPFNVLKGIERPGEYFEQLRAWFEADVHRLHNRFKGAGSLTFESFKEGACRWKPVGSEANSLPYWSCSRNRILAHGAKAPAEIDVRTMINWGSSWYVTHLGPIPGVQAPKAQTHP